MILISFLVAVIVAIVLLIFGVRSKNAREKMVISLVLYLFLGLAIILLLAESLVSGVVQIAAASFVATFLIFRTLFSSFWQKVFYHAMLILLLVWSGYLYSISQMPYPDKPFAAISNNQPSALSEKDLKPYWLLGLPINTNTSQDQPLLKSVTAVNPRGKINHSALDWQVLWGLMEKDSRIRQVLQTLREQQQQNLTAFGNQLNATSVDSTHMRRRALDKSNIDDLLKENAISQARYKTMVETWNLLDRDESAFKQRQAEERFNALLELLADKAVDESHKVELIDFMVKNFAGDIRLLNPLISLYDGLDQEYPRLKRLNNAYLQLYIAKREAILRGFLAMGQPAQQPLQDYRKKVLPTISYSQARLDDFLTHSMGLVVPSLYEVAPAKAVANLLNRKKYPALERFSGASFTQEYVRRSLRKLDAENAAPNAGEILMHLPESQYQAMSKVLASGDLALLDSLVIDPDPAVRANLAWRLAELKRPASMPIVLELMRDQNPDVRRLAVIAAANFTIKDTQGSSDPKFIEIVRMLQNYRSSSDAFGRAWAVAGLASIGDKQKALYTLDLILNDGAASQSVVGDAVASWSEEEKQVIQSLLATLNQTPEELQVKTQALNSLLAIESPEVLDVLLHYLNHIYAANHTRPSMWRYLVPHLTLPQEAENVEDVIMYLAQTQGVGHPQFHKRQLKALNVQLHQAYQANNSGEFFQLLNFLAAFDQQEYEDYLDHTSEQIRIMRLVEYYSATLPFWLACWPLTLLFALLVSYLILPALKVEPVKIGQSGNSRANPAIFANQAKTPPPAIVPIKIFTTQGDQHEA